MVTLREAVEATLRGRDERLVAKRDVDGILHVFERWDIYDIETLQANLESSYAELQEDLAPVAARSFLGLLKSTLGTVPRPSPHGIPSVPPSTPSTSAAFSSPPIHPPSPATVPLVVTIKMNGKVLAERTTLPVPPAATWEAVARMRLETVLDASLLRSRGRARHASRRASPPSSGRHSSRRVSARLAPRSRARSARSEQLDGFGNWLWQHSSLLLRLAMPSRPCGCAIQACGRV